MVIKREVAYGIVRGMSEFWNCEELQDFTVTVGETKFGCHKLLLAACSGFFRGLLRSGMRETELNCATLKGVSCETFLLILETIYTGRGVLTNENVIDIWKAAHQLQVTFLVTECEMFVLNTLSLENYVQYFHYGRLLISKVVTDTVWNFILIHCNSFFQTNYFLDLPFSDVLSLTKSQELATSSEDDVLRAILNWEEYKPDKEQQNETNDCTVLKEIIPPIEINEENSAVKLTDDSTMGLEFKDGKTDDHTFFFVCENNIQKEDTGERKDTVSDSDSREQYLFDLVSNTRSCHDSHECLKMLLWLVRISRIEILPLQISSISFSPIKEMENGRGELRTGTTATKEILQYSIAGSLDNSKFSPFPVNIGTVVNAQMYLIVKL